MNKIDYENIKKEIASRAVKYDEGGELSIEYIQRQEVGTLLDIIKDYENRAQVAKTNNLKSLIDDMFQKYGDEENNMIVLESVYAPDRHLKEEDPMELPFVNYKWNKLAFPVGMEWNATEYDDVFEDYNDMVENIKSVLFELDAPNANELFAEDDSINECWYGVTALTRNYEYVYFVLRDDGILLNNKITTYKTF